MDSKQPKLNMAGVEQLKYNCYGLDNILEESYNSLFTEQVS